MWQLQFSETHFFPKIQFILQLKMLYALTILKHRPQKKLIRESPNGLDGLLTAVDQDGL